MWWAGPGLGDGAGNLPAAPGADLIHHSDHGSQYTSIADGLRCARATILPAMGPVGDGYDHAVTASFFASLEGALRARHRVSTIAAARLADFAYRAAFDTTHRRHAAVGDLSPAACERRSTSRVAYALSKEGFLR